jgi:hypothetical protein
VRARMEICREPMHGTAFRAVNAGSDLMLTMQRSGLETLVSVVLKKIPDQCHSTERL